MTVRTLTPHDDVRLTNPEALPLQISPRGGAVFTAHPKSTAQWASLRVKDPATGMLLPVAWDGMAGKPYTDSDWAALLELEQPECTATRLDRLMKQIGAGPLTRYPYKAGPGKGLPLAMALIELGPMPAANIVNLLSHWQKKLDLSEVEHENQTLLDAALRRPRTDGLILSHWLLEQGVPISRDPAVRATSIWRFLQGRIHWEGLEQGCKAKHRFSTQMRNDGLRQRLGLFQENERFTDQQITECRRTLGRTLASRIDATQLLLDPISLVRKGAPFFEGPLIGWLLHATQEALTNPRTAEHAMDLMEDGCWFEFLHRERWVPWGATLKVDGIPTTLKELAGTWSARQAQCAEKARPAWNRLDAQLQHRLLRDSLETAPSSSRPRL